MSQAVETRVRAPDAYGLARRALALMEAGGVWPTPLNYELWLHMLAEPDGELARELGRLLEAREPFTDALSEELAARFLPRLRAGDAIRDAGDQLQRQLESIAGALEAAQTSHEGFGRTLAGAQRELDVLLEPAALRRLTDQLAFATARVKRETGALSVRLAQSTHEVRQLREHLEQMRREAMTDPLTMLANRKAFDEALAQACAEADAAHTPVTLAVFDIDHFKVFNDTWGHQTGDQVIRYVGAILGRTALAPRLASRYGGEEFALLFPGETGESAAAAVEAARAEIAQRSLKRRSTNDDLGTVTASAGVAERRPGETAAELMERADAALYVSKRTGRNRTTCADPVAAAA